MIGCRLLDQLCSVFNVFITPSISSDSYYIMYEYYDDLEEVNEVELLSFVKDVKLEENLGSKNTSMFDKFAKMMCFKMSTNTE